MEIVILKQKNACIEQMGALIKHMEMVHICKAEGIIR